MNATVELLKVKANLSMINYNHVIKEQEVVNILGNEFPTINYDLERIPNSCDVYKSVKCFVDFTKQLALKGNFKEVKHCFTVAEKLLRNGNNTVKNAIENVYVFSLSSIIDFNTPLSKKVKELLTDSLKKEYNRQICASGI